jgi:hypothetical protein
MRLLVPAALRALRQTLFYVTVPLDDDKTRRPN